MELTYGNSEPADKAVDYFLGIIEDCRELHPQDAEDKFNNLEFLFKSEGSGKTLVEKLNEAKKILNELKPDNGRCPEYLHCFNRLRYALAEIQEGFSQNYRKTA